MSGFFGIFNRNGNNVDKKIAEDILESMSGWDPDERGLWIDGPVALGHAMLWNTPESKYENLPLNKDTYILTMDARIDNREELAKEIELPDRPLSEIGDSEFILGAYEKWGEECPKYLLGDFTFALWDKTHQTLFCVRDHIGIKPFYYYVDDKVFIFANNIEGLLSHPLVDRCLDDDTIAMFMQDDGITKKRQTFFKHIKKLPAASILTVTQDNMIESCYWCIEDISPIKLDTHDDYAIRLRKLLENAVEVRLRTQYPVVSHLSGGIDSSPIAVLAARMLKKKNQKLHVYNWIDIPENIDEYEYESWHFSRRIAEREENIEHHEFAIDANYWIKLYREHNIFTKGTAFYWTENYVQNATEELKARTILSGWGGDELISYSGRYYIKGLLKQGKLIQASKYLYAERKDINCSLKPYVKKFLVKILPPTIVDYLRKKPLKNLYKAKNCKYATKYFRTILQQHKAKKFSQAWGVRDMQKIYYQHGGILERVESWNLEVSSKNIEYAYPLLDKRVVEFALAIPEALFFPKDEKNRQLIKSAVSDLLPYDILWFTKVQERKINISLKKQFVEGLKIFQAMQKNVDCDKYQQKYVDCNKMQESLLSFTFKDDDTAPLGDITMAYLLMNAISHMTIQNNKNI